MLFSFIIGFERELHSHPGGVMTHMLVGLGSCLFTMCSVHITDNYPSINSDPARICAQIVSGMGFLGSATIYKSKNYIKGINTAANLWISAAVSMAIGADLWEFAFITSLGTILVLFANNRYKIIKYVKDKEHRKLMRRRKRSKTPNKTLSKTTNTELKEVKVIHSCKTQECPICMPYCSEDDGHKTTEIDSSDFDDADNDNIKDGYEEEDNSEEDTIENAIDLQMKNTILLSHLNSFNVNDNVDNIVCDIKSRKVISSKNNNNTTLHRRNKSKSPHVTIV